MKLYGTRAVSRCASTSRIHCRFPLIPQPTLQRNPPLTFSGGTSLPPPNRAHPVRTRPGRSRLKTAPNGCLVWRSVKNTRYSNAPVTGDRPIKKTGPASEGQVPRHCAGNHWQAQVICSDDSPITSVTAIGVPQNNISVPTGNCFSHKILHDPTRWLQVSFWQCSSNFCVFVCQIGCQPLAAPAAIEDRPFDRQLSHGPPGTGSSPGAARPRRWRSEPSSR